MIGFIGLLVGVLLGLVLNINIPDKFSPYMSVAILACLDSVFGALRASLSKSFKPDIFISGFIGCCYWINRICENFRVFIQSLSYPNNVLVYWTYCFKYSFIFKRGNERWKTCNYPFYLWFINYLWVRIFKSWIRESSC